MNEDKKFLTVGELADRWGVTKENINLRRMKGNPPPWVDISAPGSKRATIRYSIPEIEKYELKHSRDSTKSKVNL